MLKMTLQFYRSEEISVFYEICYKIYHQDNPDKFYFTDSSNLVHEESRKTAYAIISLTIIVQAKALPGENSSKMADLVPLK